MNFNNFQEGREPNFYVGQALYFSRAVVQLKRNGDRFFANIKDGSSFHTELEINSIDGEITPISCSCNNHLPCKHMFAALIYIRSNNQFQISSAQLTFKKKALSAESMLDFYDTAGTAEQTLMCLLAAGLNNMKFTKMNEVLPKLGLTSGTGRSLHEQFYQLNEALPGLVNRTEDTQGILYGLPAALQKSFLEHVGNTDLMTKVAKALEAEMPALRNYYSPERILIHRNFTLGWYSPKSKLLDVILAGEASSTKQLIYIEWILDHIAKDIGKKRLEEQSLAVREGILLKLSAYALAGEIDSNWYFKQIERCQQENPSNYHTAMVLINHLTLRWDKPAMERLIEKLGRFAHLKYAIAALDALLNGQFASSVSLYQDAFKHYRKEEGIKKAYLNCVATLFYPLAVAFNNSVKDFKDAEAFIEANLLANPFTAMAYRQLFEKLKNPAHDSMMFHPNTFSNLKYNHSHLPFVIAAWLGKEAPQDVLLRWHSRTGQLGYALYQSDLAALLEQSGTKAAAAAHVPSLVGRLEKKEVWMNSLELLEALGKGIVGTVAEAKDSRVIWIVGFQYEEISAMEQKRTKLGWTSGRTIADKRLHGLMVENMTEQDRRVIQRGLKTHRTHYGVDYLWAFDEAILELAGHPLVFLADSNFTPLQIIKAEPEVIVEETPEGYRLKLVPTCHEKGGYFEKETNTRYKVYEVAERHVNLSRAMGGAPLMVPSKGRGPLLKALESLSGIVTVQSHLTDHSENLPKIIGDARLVVQVLPFGDGFQMELFVKPFTTQPPYFKPGVGSETVLADINGQKTLAQRTLHLEIEEVEKLRFALPELGLLFDENMEAALSDDEQCLNALALLNPLVLREEVSVEWPKGEKLRIQGVAGLGRFSLTVRSQQDWFGLEGEVRVDEETVLSLTKIMGLLRENPERNFIRLDSNRFIALTKELARRIQQLDALAQSHQNELRVNNLAALRLEELGAGLANFDADTRWLEQQQKIKDAKAQKFRVPKTLLAELRPYQTEGFAWLAQMAHWGVGACLADDMGLGKTVQAIALLLNRASKGPALVVAPTSVSNNWVQELQRFSPSLNVQLLGGNTRASTIKSLKANDVLVCSYGLMLSEAKVLDKKPFATIILDEAQAIKNKNTKRSSAVMGLQADFRLILTGTPLENHLGELWNLFNFINPGLLGSLEYFREKFAIPIERDKDAVKREELKKLISPFILRRMKNDVLTELPPKTEIILSVTMSDEEQAFYEALRRNALQKLESSDAKAGEKQLQILAELMRLRQAACNPQLVEPGVPIGSSKLDLFGELVGELIENGHRALVFSQFVKHLALVKQYLDSQKISYQYLDGSTPAKSRQALVDAFQNGEGQLFLISLKAGGTGLNLTAADYVIHLDPWWNPAVEDQASDRAHRIGQLKPVTVYRLVSANTVEDKIVQLHEHKRDLVSSLLADSDVSGKLNANDLLELIKGKP